jgi:hypothetical protein
MKPTDIGAVIILIVAVTALVFVITRARLEQGDGRVPLNEIVRNVRRDASQFFGSIFSVVGIVIWFVIIVAVVLGGLWLVVAVVKWMWEHS